MKRIRKSTESGERKRGKRWDLTSLTLTSPSRENDESWLCLSCPFFSDGHKGGTPRCTETTMALGGWLSPWASFYFRTRSSVRRWQLEKLREELCPPGTLICGHVHLLNSGGRLGFCIDALCALCVAAAALRHIFVVATIVHVPISRFRVDWLLSFFCLLPRDVLKLYCTAKGAAFGANDGEKTARRDRRWHLQGRRLQCSVHDCRMALPTGPEVSRLGSHQKRRTLLLSR